MKMKHMPPREINHAVMDKGSPTFAPFTPVENDVLIEVIQYVIGRLQSDEELPEPVAHMAIRLGISMQNLKTYKWACKAWHWSQSRTYRFYQRLGAYPDSEARAKPERSQSEARVKPQRSQTVGKEGQERGLAKPERSQSEARTKPERSQNEAVLEEEEEQERVSGITEKEFNDLKRVGSLSPAAPGRGEPSPSAPAGEDPEPDTTVVTAIAAPATPSPSVSLITVPTASAVSDDDDDDLFAGIAIAPSHVYTGEAKPSTIDAFDLDWEFIYGEDDDPLDPVPPASPVPVSIAPYVPVPAPCAALRAEVEEVPHVRLVETTDDTDDTDDTGDTDEIGFDGLTDKERREVDRDVARQIKALRVEQGLDVPDIFAAMTSTPTASRPVPYSERMHERRQREQDRIEQEETRIAQEKTRCEDWIDTVMADWSERHAHVVPAVRRLLQNTWGTGRGDQMIDDLYTAARYFTPEMMSDVVTASCGRAWLVMDEEQQKVWLGWEEKYVI